MRICYFFSDNPWASWGLSRGYPAALAKMGHEVTHCPIPTAKELTQVECEAMKAAMPRDLNDFDLVVTCGPEYLGLYLTWVYGDGYYQHKVKTPRAAIYLENSRRSDKDLKYETLKSWGDYHFYPGRQDAQWLKGTWLPFGVDVDLFTPEPRVTRDIDCAFIGLMYDRRAKFLESTVPHLAGKEVLIGQVLVNGLDGLMPTETAALLAKEYRRVKVSINLPALNPTVTVAKVFEAMASGAISITNRISPLDDIAENAVYYSTPKELAAMLRYYLDNETLSAELARKAREEVVAKHSTVKRMESMLAGVRERKAA